jgi:hypothetical protein
MRIQFKILMFYSRSEEQLQEWNNFKESGSSFLVVIGALDSPLGPHPESDLDTNLYYVSTPIDNMDESDCWINLNRLKKSTTSLPEVIGALSSPL